MIVLTAIAAFFKKIWDWIRATAWVQPLLIVGIIFGVIFSIPSIVNAIKNAQKEASATENFYHKYQLTISGGSESSADNSTRILYNAQENPTAENIEAVKNEFGTDKFFFVYVADTCEKCVEAKYGFDYLEKNWNQGGYQVGEGETFKLVSIFTDEYTAETTSEKTAFVQYMERHTAFFEDAAAAGYNTDYYALGHLSDSDLEALGEAHPTNFLTPTILLIDFSENSPQQGVSEVMFGVSGSTDKAKADLLLHCWNHTDEFSID